MGGGLPLFPGCEDRFVGVGGGDIGECLVHPLLRYRRRLGQYLLGILVGFAEREVRPCDLAYVDHNRVQLGTDLPESILGVRDSLTQCPPDRPYDPDGGRYRRREVSQLRYSLEPYGYLLKCNPGLRHYLLHLLNLRELVGVGLARLLVVNLDRVDRLPEYRALPLVQPGEGGIESVHLGLELRRSPLNLRLDRLGTPHGLAGSLRKALSLFTLLPGLLKVAHF